MNVQEDRHASVRLG